jgi:hypothetical protein
MSWKRPAIDPEQREQERRERIARQVPPTGRIHRGVMGGTTSAPAQPVWPKIETKASPKIRDSARGEVCTVRIPGVCTNDPETTIWSHARWLAAGKGKSTKAIDVAGCYCCVACDAVYDGQRPPPPGYTREQVDADWCMGHFRSLVRLAEKGLL